MRAILATLGYVFSPDGRRVLLLHRDARPDDHHYGKYIGLGGKLERDEDAVAGMRREIAEEAGIECDELELAGTVSWPGFGRDGEDWFGFLFRVTAYSGTVLDRNPEGDLHFLPLVFAGKRQFHGVMPYADGRPTGWRYSELGATT